jgi:colicin import membrane protein
VAGQGNLDNDADTRNAATEAEELWDSGDRRTRLAQRLSNLLGGRPEGKDAAEAILLTDQDQGTPPTDAVRSTMRSPKARKNTGRTAGRERGLDLG